MRDSIDFPLPCVDKSGEQVGCEPLPCVGAVVLMRQLLGALGVAHAEVYTMHSYKVTLLTWLTQLRVPDDQQARQGHHKTWLQHSSDLHGHNDVMAGHEAQKIVLSNILEGWVPTPAGDRGSLPALPEAAVKVPLQALLPLEFEAACELG